MLAMIAMRAMIAMLAMLHYIVERKNSTWHVSEKRCNVSQRGHPQPGKTLIN